MIDIIDWNTLHEQHPDFVELVGEEIDELDWYALLLAGAGLAYLTSLFSAEVKSTDFMAHPMVGPTRKQSSIRHKTFFRSSQQDLFEKIFFVFYLEIYFFLISFRRL